MTGMHFGDAVVKLRWPILILALVLLIPSVLGMVSTRVNYDMLDYLPDDMDTVKGQNELLEDFGKGAFSLIIVEDMPDKDVAKLVDKIEGIEHVETVVWYSTLADISIPKELLPDALYDEFNTDNATMMAVFFDSATSADVTMDAIRRIRSVAGRQCFVSGMSALVTDLKALCEQEEPIYVGLAVLFATLAMLLFLDSWLVPFVFLASIGMMILMNLGSNYFLGEISYITKALSAVLQLAVTMDYSIFLWHSYKEAKETMVGASREEAMAKAVANTITSVVGSSITTVAGFIALCFMTFTLGLDLGLVMAKGVVLGVLGCVTTLPSLILIFDKAITKTLHKPLIPNVSKLSRFIVGHGWIFLLIFALIIGPAFYGYQRTPVYYDFSVALPEDMPCVVANKMLSDEFDMGNMHMALIDANLDKKQVKEMSKEMENVDGVRFVLGLESELGSAMPDEMVQGKLTDELKGDNYQLMLISSEYGTATDEVNAQIDDLNAILKKYDSTGMLIGEAPCTKDLIEVTSHDFDVVNAISILSIFVIILLVTRSLSLPVLLLAVIEFAVFINLGLPFYTGTELSFVAPICLSTIQLGATVDYAILMTTRYKTERLGGKTKRDAVETALTTSMPSIIVSALCFFAATFGVGLYSDVDIISSMCNLIARGALVSMASVIFVLPSGLMLLDRIILKTTWGMTKIHKRDVENQKGVKA